MDKRRVLTRIELLVLVGAIVFIVFLVLLMQHMGKRRPRAAAACLTALKEWGPVFERYTSDNDGCFFSGEGRGDGYWWIDSTRNFWQTKPKSLLCPMATKPFTDKGRNEFSAWKVDGVSGSYGMNGWMCNPQQGKTELWGHGPIENYWRTSNVKEAGDVPLFFDAAWPDTWPEDTDVPPESPARKNAKGMQRVCFNRHEGYVNVLFMDHSVRKTRLKQLWKLKWHRNYNTDGPWTHTGGAQPMDWPAWMRMFRDY